jgi:hypothetical protein
MLRLYIRYQMGSYANFDFIKLQLRLIVFSSVFLFSEYSWNRRYFLPHGLGRFVYPKDYQTFDHLLDRIY